MLKLTIKNNKGEGVVHFWGKHSAILKIKAFAWRLAFRKWVANVGLQLEDTEIAICGVADCIEQYKENNQ